MHASSKWPILDRHSPCRLPASLARHNYQQSWQGQHCHCKLARLTASRIAIVRALTAPIGLSMLAKLPTRLSHNLPQHSPTDWPLYVYAVLAGSSPSLPCS